VPARAGTGRGAAPLELPGRDWDAVLAELAAQRKKVKSPWA
jgi:hypothetical protein